jgi:hypothetical protein
LQEKGKWSVVVVVASVTFVETVDCFDVVERIEEKKYGLSIAGRQEKTRGLES